ncbi:MAG: Crp/Fnr family transcriptional regulator [Paracoccaceae bacterium]
MRRFEAKKGKVIFSPGQDCPGFILLSEGTIRVTLTGSSGREVVLYRVHPGEVCLQTFCCLIEGHTYRAEGVAETDFSGEMVPADQFNRRLEDDHAFRQHVMNSVALRFSEYQKVIEEIALTNFDARLAKVLLRLAGADGKVVSTHSALAAETASGRAYVTRRLAEFAKQGLVEQLSDGISVLNGRMLEQIAAGTR